MSLINDALKRAQEARQQKPADGSGGPPLRPVEPRPQGGNNLWLLLAFAVVVAVAAILLWQWFQQSRQRHPLAANPPPSAQTSPAPSSATHPAAISTLPPNSSNLKPGEVPARAIVPAEPAPVAPNSPPPVVAAKQVEPIPPPVTGAGSVPATNGQALANAATHAPDAEATPKPAPLKLQGIIFHPTRPSVVINGKLLFVGDRVSDWRVTAIDARTVTLIGSGKTNVLTLE